VPVSESANRGSRVRKQALRLLAREQHAEYATIYQQIRPDAPTRYQARDWARTRLRQRHPNRYLELCAQIRASPASDVPAGIRSKSWHRATTRLADLRAPAYRKLFTQFRAGGMNRAAAYDRAMAVLRDADSDLFTSMLTEEYQLWLLAAATPASRTRPQDPPTAAPGQAGPGAPPIRSQAAR
jgi:hypothetical protein